MSDEEEEVRKRKKSRKNRDWDEEEDESGDDQAMEPSRNALDVQIKSKGFQNKVESDVYRKFKKRSNKNFEVQEISLDQLKKLEHTNQIGGKEGKTKKKKIDKKSKKKGDNDSEDEEEQISKKRRSGAISRRPFTPELESPRIISQNT